MTDQKIQLILEAINKTDKEFSALKKQLGDLDGQVKQNAGFWQKLTKDADSFRLKSGEIEQSLQSLVSAFLLYKGISIFKSAIDEAEKAQNSIRGLGAVARYNGIEIGTAMQAASELAADGLVDITDVSKALQNLLQRGFKLDEAVAMLERLKDSAAFNRQASLSMSQAVVSATEGLKNENSILVDNAGVTKNVSIMWKEYAAQIGKSVTELTQAEKRQAEYAGIMKETEAQLGNAKLATEGLTGAKAKLAVETQKLQRSLGETLAPAFLTIATAANWTLKNAIIPFIGGLEMASAKIAAFFSIKGWKEEEAALTGAIALAQKQGDTAKVAKYEAQLQGIKTRLAAADKTLDEQIADINKRWSGELALPKLGADKGARRQNDTPPPAAAGNKPEKTPRTGGKTPEELAAEEELRRVRKFADEWLAQEREKEAYLEENRRAFQEYLAWRKEESEEAAAAAKKAAEERQAVQEAEINQQLADLDVAEKTGMAHRETIGERIRLLANLQNMQEVSQRKIDRSTDQGTLAWYAQAEAIRRTQTALAGLRQEQLKLTPGGAFALSLKQTGEQMTDLFSSVDGVVKKTFSGMTDALTEFTMTGKLSFNDLANSIIRDMVRIAWQQQVTGPLATAGGNFLAGLLGGGSAQGAYGDVVTGDSLAGFHRGGMGKEPTFYRIVPNPNLLPRYHGGLGPGERYSVTTDDEMILTPGQQKRFLELAQQSGSRDTAIPTVNETHVHLTVNALDSRSVSQALAQHQNQIVGLVNMAYNKRGQRGPLGS